MAESCACHSCGHDDGHKHENEERNLKAEFFKIVLSVIFVVLGVIFEDNNILSTTMFLCGYLTIGYNIIWGAIKGLRSKSFLDENFLMTIASIGAIVLGEFVEGIAVMLLYTIGSLFEEMALGKSRRSIQALLSLKPDIVNIVDEEGNVVSADPNDVAAGSLILVKPGERIPIDGTVVRGQSALDASAISGESLPVDVKEGDNVYSGAININGVLYIKTTVLYKESTVAKILELTQNAQEKKTKSEQFITKFSKYYTPAVVALAVLIALVPPLILGFAENLPIYFERALMFLVVSCPCALVISVPLTYFGAIGAFSKKGILVKGSNYIEQLTNIKTVAFDKTGTLTEGRFKVLFVKAADGISELELIETLLVAESMSNHPIARAIVDNFSGQSEAFEPVKNIEEPEFEDISGKGIKVTYGGETILVGNKKLLLENNIKFDENLTATVVYAAKAGRYMGCVVLDDILKSSSAEVISYLNSSGIKTVMLTGDSEIPAKSVADKINITEFEHSLLPADKAAHVERLKNASALMFLGDGINDAPSIMLADIGVAMGGRGSEYAVEISDMVIIDDDISKLPFMFRMARKTKHIVTENIVFALSVKAVILALSMFGLTNMWLAIFADVGVSILAILNALRMLK